MTWGNQRKKPQNWNLPLADCSIKVENKTPFILERFEACSSKSFKVQYQASHYSQCYPFTHVLQSLQKYMSFFGAESHFIGPYKLQQECLKNVECYFFLVQFLASLSPSNQLSIVLNNKLKPENVQKLVHNAQNKLQILPENFHVQVRMGAKGKI